MRGINMRDFLFESGVDRYRGIVVKVMSDGGSMSGAGCVGGGWTRGDRTV